MRQSSQRSEDTTRRLKRHDAPLIYNRAWFGTFPTADEEAHLDDYLEQQGATAEMIRHFRRLSAAGEAPNPIQRATRLGFLLHRLALDRLCEEAEEEDSQNDAILAQRLIDSGGLDKGFDVIDDPPNSGVWRHKKNYDEFVARTGYTPQPIQKGPANARLDLFIEQNSKIRSGQGRHDVRSLALSLFSA